MKKWIEDLKKGITAMISSGRLTDWVGDISALIAEIEQEEKRNQHLDKELHDCRCGLTQTLLALQQLENIKETAEEYLRTQKQSRNARTTKQRHNWLCAIPDRELELQREIIKYRELNKELNWGVKQ